MKEFRHSIHPAFFSASWDCDSDFLPYTADILAHSGGFVDGTRDKPEIKCSDVSQFKIKQILVVIFWMFVILKWNSNAIYTALFDVTFSINF